MFYLKVSETRENLDFKLMLAFTVSSQQTPLLWVPSGGDSRRDNLHNHTVGADYSTRASRY